MYYHKYQPFYNPTYYRSYPDIDLTMFEQSIQQSQKIANDCLIMLNTFSNKEFAYQVMSAAQNGNQQEVDRLLESIGVDSSITSTYTPSGISLKLHTNAYESPCCFFTIFLKWGE
ncbi:hypothetical protein [Gracilibacillus kekensis]|uniref:Uncharacterized protein n=1 Tax=Gracilibacillus kekensis TaxID=1027249 RepID=A0A1M7PMZ6_9BACI|nr:hypothetical protein [Gracilibacillus kekensis]SHN18468.1 hypothetical protein SAMN05216179_2350 [Gracilibacillus kekensis]